MSTNLRPVAADVLAWLTTQPLGELPSIYTITIHARSSYLRSRVEAHLDSGELAALAAWAEHLTTTVTVQRTSTGSLDARMVTTTDSGHSVELWTFLDDDAERALTSILDPVTLVRPHRPDESISPLARVHQPVEITAARLWQATTASITRYPEDPETGDQR